MRKRTETRLVDTMIDAYVDWREACRLVDDPYRSWRSATGPRAAYWRYTAALDAESLGPSGHVELKSAPQGRDPVTSLDTFVILRAERPPAPSGG